MVRLGWIKRHGDKVEQTRELLRFFGVASPAQWQECWANPQASFRRARSFDSQPEALTACTHSICAFADALGIAPGIVAGRLQHDGHVPFSHYHDLKRRFEWG